MIGSPLRVNCFTPALPHMVSLNMNKYTEYFLPFNSLSPSLSFCSRGMMADLENSILSVFKSELGRVALQERVRCWTACVYLNFSSPPFSRWP